MINLLVFILGSVIGSFLNVCIYRIPRDQSIIFPRSRCVSCEKPIAWYDNIPFLSYILLKGRCRSCKEKISFRYFAVELISAVAFLVLFLYFGVTYKFFIYSLLTFSLIVVSFIDLEFQIIPDRITIAGVILGIALSIWKGSLAVSLLGAFIGAGLIYITGVFGKLVFKKESMGGGDVKLMAMLGAFLGWKMAVLIFFLAPFLGTPAGLYVKFRKKQDIIPYGPYISMASFIVMIWGQKILSLLFL